jgi:hypothetical protein
MALIYKHFLDILKVESGLYGADRWNRAGCEELQPFCVAFQGAISDGDTTTIDRLNILPKALKCTARLLSKLVSLVETRVNHEKLTIVVVESLHRLFHLLQTSTTSEQRRQMQRALIDDQASVVLVYLHLLTILEVVAQSVTAGDTPTNGVDREPLAESALDLYNSLLAVLYFSSSADDSTAPDEGVAATHKLNSSFEGPLGSQAVLSLLTLAKHRSKRVANSAAGCLLLTTRCFADQRETWRACFPGAFSGLFLLTQSGFKGYVLYRSRILSALPLP